MTKKKNNTLEERVKNTLLEQAITVQVGAQTYEVAPPSLATLILVSEVIARIPNFTLDPDKMVQECFGVARHCRFLGEVAAILILGAKRSELRATPSPGKFKSCLRTLCFGRRRRQKDVLAERILLELSPKELFRIVSRILGTLELSDFFGLTTFLLEINLLHPTGEVES